MRGDERGVENDKGMTYGVGKDGGVTRGRRAERERGREREGGKISPPRSFLKVGAYALDSIACYPRN